MASVEVWPLLEHPVLCSSQSAKVCMTCRFFRHHAATNGMSILTCALHRALVPQGAHLASRCECWNDDVLSQKQKNPGQPWV